MSERNVPLVLSRAEAGMEASPVDSGGKYYEHPGLPGKLLRWNNGIDHGDKTIPVFKSLLEELRDRYHIPVVQTDFVVSDSEQPASADVVIVSDKIDDAVPLERLQDPSEMPEEVVDEFDLLTQRIIAHLRDVYEQGGAFCTELYQYRQYVYSPSRPRGQRLILVDIEPIGFYYEPPNGGRIPGYGSIVLLESIADISNDLLVLEHQTHRELAAASEIIDLVSTIQNNGIASLEEAKQRIVAAIEQSDPGLLDPIRGTAACDYEDSLFADDFWFDTAESVDRALEKKRYI